MTSGRAAKAPAGRAALEALARQVAGCRRCPRLVEHRERIARERRRQFADQEYWGRPVPGFGDAGARLLIVGLAPAAHGANRTGRMFTGDRSGDWLYRALYAHGFASQAESRARDDGMVLRDVYVSAAVRCAPPDNKPTREEFAACLPFLRRELELLSRVRVVLALGKLAFDAYLAARIELALAVPRPRARFGHGARVDLGDVIALASYHPSQQNTFTGRLTRPAFHSIFAQARRELGRGSSSVRGA